MIAMMIYPLAFGMPGFPELCVVALIGLLLFGKRLPEVGRSIGKTVVEFKKGMREVTNEITNVDNSPPVAPTNPTESSSPQPTAKTEAQPYKFDPYSGKAVESQTTNEKL
jgi:sec-independent protein translocase protein TatA